MPETLTPREAFKASFCMQAASAGYGPGDLGPLLDAAEAKLSKAANVLADLAAGAVKIPLGLAVAGAAGLGAAGGIAHHTLTANKVDPDEIKRDELVDTYNHFTERMKLLDQARRAAAAQPKPQPRRF